MHDAVFRWYMIIIQGDNTFSETVRNHPQRRILPLKSRMIGNRHRHLIIYTVIAFHRDKVHLLIPDIADIHIITLSAQLQIDGIFQQIAVSVTEPAIKIIPIGQIIRIIFDISRNRILTSYIVLCSPNKWKPFHNWSSVSSKRTSL